MTDGQMSYFFHYLKNVVSCHFVFLHLPVECITTDQVKCLVMERNKHPGHN